MNKQDCQESLRHAEKEWGKLKTRLDECANHLSDAEKKLNEAAYDRQKCDACLLELEEAYEQIDKLKKERDELFKFKKYIRHPDVWIENALDPLAKFLGEFSDLLGLEAQANHQRRLEDPVELVREWAHKLYQLLSRHPGEAERKEAEVYLVALWHWIRLEEIIARFEE